MHFDGGDWVQELREHPENAINAIGTNSMAGTGQSCWLNNLNSQISANGKNLTDWTGRVYWLNSLNSQTDANGKNSMANTGVLSWLNSPNSLINANGKNSTEKTGLICCAISRNSRTDTGIFIQKEYPNPGWAFPKNETGNGLSMGKNWIIF